MSDLPGGQNPPEDELDLGEIVDDLNEPPEDPEGEEGQEPPEGEGSEGEDEPPLQTTPQRRRGEAQRWRERAERTERELAELRGQVQTLTAPRPAGIDPAAAQRAEAEKWERRAMMSPVELAQDMAREFQDAQRQTFAMQQYQTNNAIDKLSYEAEARTSALHRTYQQRVEAMVGREHARGNMLSREQALAWLHWEDTKAKAAKLVPGQRRAAQRRVNGQRVPPTNPRGDGAGGRARDTDSIEAARKRVANQPLWE